MRILPVIDILNGIAVRGVAGNRERYRALESRYCETANPVDVAKGLQQHFGFREFYVADLDAIQKRKPNIAIYRQLVERGLDLLLDAGISEAKRLNELQGVSDIVGLETLGSWNALDEMTSGSDSCNLIFSLDLKHGVPIEDRLDRQLHDPLQIVERVIDAGIRRIIVLDLAQVGTGQGVTTLELCTKIKSQYPDCELFTGGGIQTAADLAPIEAAGIDAVLVATALHNGSLNEETIAKWE